jgi:hypothetical protein
MKRTRGLRILRWLLPTGASVLSLALAGPGLGQTNPPTPVPTTTAPAPAAVLTLADCLHMAQEGNPRLSAKRAALAAAEDAKRAVDNLHVPDFVDRELPIRRRQASRGVAAAAADLQQTEREVAYGVTRSYLTLVYARDQEKVARRIVDQLGAIGDLAQQAVELGADKNAKASTVDRIRVYQRLAETKLIEATEGQKRAQALLREALGQPVPFHFVVAPSRLPDPRARLERDEVVAAALAQRGEVIQARLFAEVTCLEVEAQGTSLHLKMETFAAGSDIHSSVVPGTLRNHDYRPGALPPAMPTLLVGSKAERVQRATDLNAEAEAIVQVTSNLVSLEAEDAFLRWEQATAQVAKSREAADKGDSLAKDLNAVVRSTKKSSDIEDALTASVLASQARSQYNEYLLNLNVALADLERVTGGLFCAHLAELSIPAEVKETK